MISRTGKAFDIIIITGEYYDDHPLSPAGVIARVLDAEGYNVGIIEKPLASRDFLKLGKPSLCFCVTSGSIDSMLNNYTPFKKPRLADRHSKTLGMPDRAVIVYSNGIRQNFKNAFIVIGGVEASLRRFAHYDYWDNRVRRSLLLDSRSDVLVYGNGEKQIVEIASRLKAGEGIKGIRGTCVLSKELPAGFKLLPSCKEVSADTVKFCRMQALFSNYENLAQEYDNNYVLQYRYPAYTPADLDRIYSLGYKRKLHPASLLGMAKFSVVTHRGCIGNCNFCSLALHQGNRIISRTEESILKEIAGITKHPEFKGYIDDLGGPSANMYGMDCLTGPENGCDGRCRQCGTVDLSHSRAARLLEKARNIKGVKKIFVRSGIRYDLAMKAEGYLKELFEHHISGCLKIAPEHLSGGVLALMNKPGGGFYDFVDFFNLQNKSRKQYLKYYFMIGHPGDGPESVKFLARELSAKKITNLEQFQFFTPTPMTVSACMYWTEMNPFTMEKIKVAKDYRTKKEMKRILLGLTGKQ